MLPNLLRSIEEPLHRTEGNSANAVPLARIFAGLLYASQNEGARDDWPHLPTLLTCKESRGFECDPIARWLPFNIARQRKSETSPADARQQIQKAGVLLSCYVFPLVLFEIRRHTRRFVV